MVAQAVGISSPGVGHFKVLVPYDPCALLVPMFSTAKFAIRLLGSAYLPCVSKLTAFWTPDHWRDVHLCIFGPPSVPNSSGNRRTLNCYNHDCSILSTTAYQSFHVNNSQLWVVPYYFLFNLSIFCCWIDSFNNTFDCPWDLVNLNHNIVPL